MRRSLRKIIQPELAALLLALAACNNSAPIAGGDVKSPADGVARPYVSAHRGGAAYAPENTMMAYRNAARLGVDDFETDAWVTTDGVLILLHDQTLDRTTDCSGQVTQRSYADLQACDAGYWFTPGQGTTSPDESSEHPARGKGVTIPTAEELFAFTASFIGDYQPTVTIELKDQLAAAQEADVLVPLIKASGIQDRIIVQSFSARGIDRVKALDPTIRTLYLTSQLPGADYALNYAIRNGHDIVAPSSGQAALDADFVQRAHAAGKLVVPWTPDHEDELQELSDIGVDGMITNFPGCLLEMESRLSNTRLLPEELGDGDVALCK